MAAKLEQESYDVIVIGAGFGGLITAHRYLGAHPSASLIILDRNVHVGGVWSRDRIYPGFYTQFVKGLAEFSDLALPPPSPEDCVGDCFKAVCMSRYLDDFAEKMVHGGKSLRERYRRAEVLDTSPDDVHISVTSGPKPPTTLFTAHKLVIATGEFSRPNIPTFKNQSAFDAPIIHSTNFGESNILATPNIKHFAVLGAGKSAADMLYIMLKSLPPDAKAHWIIRDDGTGPGFFAPIDLPSPYANAVDAANTYAMGLLQPSLWHDEKSWWVWFLHQTWLGIWLVTFIFGSLDDASRKRAGYATRGGDAKKRGFDQLDYSPGVFWMNGPGGALHHADFWDVVAERVTVHRTSIEELGPHTLALSNGTSISCDALLLGTGWTPSLSFISPALAAQLGLPHSPSMITAKEKARWAALDTDATKNVLARFPLLANPPPHRLKGRPTTPYRLYRGMAPLSDIQTRSIVFTNFLVSGNMIMNAEIQALWATAYLSSSPALHLPSLAEMQMSVSEQVIWSQKRYLSMGQAGNYAGFDSMAYWDVVLRDVGQERCWEKRGVWGVRRARDLRNAWEGYLEGERRREKGG
ncbi:flavin-binding monooxygenase-like protein-like protein [Pyrenochaeta sp. DS3sAY3a]|nr:flavin-binding monooxygenase-like protein-like protein [Pyrenochaeta sp. DS3sAY3a]